ncbi:MAG TPA: NrfD/PsrC family molybdoenzyme membrane anchor subunit [Candidatus Acidoferrales bacterium]|nr:NrfD/PsrC family molybdoenzyme membrane anchor subunit [Candidatus Acidoferrales bacterium]
MKKLLYGLWGVAFLVGLIGVGQRILYGHQLAGYGSYVVWGLWVAAYIYFIGLSAGAFLLSSLVYVFGVKRLEKIGKLSLFTALVTLFMALLSIWFDLGHMGRFWKVYTSFAWESMMAWMVWLYTAYFILLLVETWFVMKPDLVRWSSRTGFEGTLARRLTFGQSDISTAVLEKDKRTIKALATVGIPLAVAFHGGVGALFGVIGARPYWHSALFPILFLVGALASGGALLTAIVAFFWPRDGKAEHEELVALMGKITLGLLVFDFLLEWAEVSIALWGSIPSHVAGFKLMLFGPYWWVFWIVHLLLGGVVPVALLTLWPSSTSAVGTAAALIAATFMSVRLNIVIPALAVPEFEGLISAYTDARLQFYYFPTLHEWLLMMFVVTVGIALFNIGFRTLPLVQTKES